MRSFHEQRQYFLYGLLAVILGCGDAFHLVPRAVALCTSGLENYTAALGMGKMITSVTMTVFYVLLYYVWKLRYDKKDAAGLRQQYGSWQFCASFCVLCRRINGQAQMLRYLIKVELSVLHEPHYFLQPFYGILVFHAVVIHILAVLTVVQHTECNFLQK